MNKQLLICLLGLSLNSTIFLSAQEYRSFLTNNDIDGMITYIDNQGGDAYFNEHPELLWDVLKYEKNEAFSLWIAKHMTVSLEKDSEGLTSLQRAIVLRRYRTAQMILEQWQERGIFDPLQTGQYGGTYLHDLCLRAHSSFDKTSLLQALISAGVPINQTNKWNRSPLLETLYNSWPEGSMILLESGAACDEPELLPMAVKNKTLISEFLEGGADPDSCKAGEEPALFHTSDPDTVEILLKAGANPNYQGLFDRTPLHLMVYEKSDSASECFRLLMEYGADINGQDKDGRTPFYNLLDRYNTEGNFMEMLETVLTYDPNLSPEWGANGELTSLAVKEGRTDILNEERLKRLGELGLDISANGNKAVLRTTDLPTIRLLLDHGADGASQNEYGVNLLMHLISLSPTDEALFERILRSSDIHQTCYNGMNVLMVLFDSENGNWEYLPSLLSHGASLEDSNDEGKTALEYAITSKQITPERLGYLLDQYGDVDLPGNKGKSPLQSLLCSKYLGDLSLFDLEQRSRGTPYYQLLSNFYRDSSLEGLFPLCDEFLLRGADLNHLDSDGTPLLFSPLVVNRDLYNKLISAGAREDVRNSEGESFLHYLARIMDSRDYPLEDFQELIDSQDDQGRTPVYQALASMNFQSVMNLIDEGCDLSIADHQGRTPFEMMVGQGDLAIVREIKSQDSDIDSYFREYPSFSLAYEEAVEKVDRMIEKESRMTIGGFFYAILVFFLYLFDK